MSQEAAGAAPAGSGPLPEPVRQRVVAFAADRLGELPDAEVPASLRRVSRFTPSKRARLAGAALAAAVDSDPAFRHSVAESVRRALPELATALASGAAPAAADPYDVAAAAYLLRTAGWQEILAAAVAATEQDSRSTRETAGELERLSTKLAEARALARDEREKARQQVAGLTTQLEEVRRAQRQATDAQRRADEARRAAETERDEARTAVERMEARAAADARRTRTRIAELEAQVEQVRKAGRGARSSDDVRLWLLLESVTNAATGLRRELALPPAAARPADEVAAGLASAEPTAPAAFGLSHDDPAWLDAVLAVPGTHVIVDGYNVTKTGFPGVPLEAQRTRLVQGLAALAVRTSAEVTVVFDGTDRTGQRSAPGARGVRVLFSPTGRTADDVIVDLVRAEPAGRPLAVVSADREVVTRVQRQGARGVPPLALLSVLSRT